MKDSFIFSLFTEIEFSLSARLASPLEDKNPVDDASKSIAVIPFVSVDLGKLACGTHSKTSKKVASSSCFKANEVAFPKRISEA